MPKRVLWVPAAISQPARGAARYLWDGPDGSHNRRRSLSRRRCRAGWPAAPSAMRHQDEVRRAEKARRPLPAGRRLGDAALRRGDWGAARDAFASALKIEESPEALEGLGLAAWWLDLADEVFASRERAYRLFVERDDRPAAARVAVWMAWDCCAFRGETAIANGWLQRARRLLAGLPACSERAWLEVAKEPSRSWRRASPIALATFPRGASVSPSGSAARTSRWWGARCKGWRGSQPVRSSQGCATSTRSMPRCWRER